MYFSKINNKGGYGWGNVLSYGPGNMRWEKQVCPAHRHEDLRRQTSVGSATCPMPQNEGFQFHKPILKSIPEVHSPGNWVMDPVPKGVTFTRAGSQPVNQLPGHVVGIYFKIGVCNWSHTIGPKMYEPESRSGVHTSYHAPPFPSSYACERVSNSPNLMQYVHSRYLATWPPNRGRRMEISFYRPVPIQ